MLHTIQKETHEVFFCTITCYNWLPLIEESQCYRSVYRWFEHLKKDGCHVVGYVIMPNHFHVLLYPTHSGTSLNLMIGECKRFMAYDIVSSLKKQNKVLLLDQMQQGVQPVERRRGKVHQVFHLSFDTRKCFSQTMIEQKLRYIHHNPVRGKWNLVDDFTRYEHSSAGFYELDNSGYFGVTHYKDLGSIGFAAPGTSESSYE